MYIYIHTYVCYNKFINNNSTVLSGSGSMSIYSSFVNCEFNGNVAPVVDGRAFAIFRDIYNTLEFYDCIMGDSTFESFENVKFIDTEAPDGAIDPLSSSSGTITFPGTVINRTPLPMSANRDDASGTLISNGAGSIFGEGSLAIIIAVLALVSSIASMGVSFALHKKKAVPTAASNTKAEDEE